MSNENNKDVTSIARVYKGAAFLIFVVGLRSVFYFRRRRGMGFFNNI